MPAHLIDGKTIAASLRRAVRERTSGLSFQPGLAVVLVGDNAASMVYVRNKDRAAQEAGLRSRTIRLPATTNQADLLGVIARLNDDADVDGILVQLPLPASIDVDAVIDAIDPGKDVDGFHPSNVGRLQSGREALAPCTPAGVMKLLAAAQTKLRGARATVLGRSSIVGRPMAALLLSADATVTTVHSRTQDIAAECRQADILIAAVGRPEMVRGDWIKPGATVIDVGINRLENGRIVGDCAFQECAAVAAAITPVPGGVGPMTIACLLENTLTAAIRRRS